MSLNFNPRVARVLDQIEQFGFSHDPMQTDRQLKMLNLERPTAELIHVMLLSSARKQVLEIGTSNGFSAIVIGATLEAIEGAVPLTTVERDPVKVSGARTNIAQANLRSMVQVIQGSATEVVRELAGPFDCVFFDADRLSAREQLQILLPKLTPDVLLLADNVLSHPHEIADYITEVEQLPDFVSITVPVGKGLHVAYRQKANDAPKRGCSWVAASEQPNDESELKT